MAILDRFDKQPADNRLYYIDYSDWLPTSVSVDTVVASSIEVLNPASGDVGEPTLAISSPSVVGADRASYFVSSGTSGKNYKVTFQATMSDTQIIESEIEFRVLDK